MLPRYLKVEKNSQELKSLIKLGSTDLKPKEQMFKIMVNALFGLLGYKRSPVKNVATSAAITLLARKYIAETVHILREKFNLDVVYVDTDGVKFRTISSNGKRYGDDVCSLVTNSLGKKFLILEDEGIVDLLIVIGRKTYVNVKFEGNPPSRAEVKCKGFEAAANDVIKVTHTHLKHIHHTLKLSRIHTLKTLSTRARVSLKRIIFRRFSFDLDVEFLPNTSSPSKSTRTVIRTNAKTLRVCSLQFSISYRPKS